MALIMISEQSIEASKPNIIDMIRGRVVVEAILQDMNIKNRNGRWYGDTELVPQLTCPRQKELLGAGGVPGEAGHPHCKDLARQASIDPLKVSHYITKFDKKGNDIVGIIRAARGVAGDLYNDTVLDGILTAYSLRALGSVTPTSRGAEVKNLKMITYDWVYYPSHVRAYQQASGSLTEADNMYINECVEDLSFSIVNEQVIDYVKTKSSAVKNMVEAAEFEISDAQLSEDARTILLTDKANTQLLISLESFITSQVRDFCANYKF